MAMPKLILKSVMWGADKIPDHWFEKVPGGYYSPDQGRSPRPRNERGGSDNSGGSGRRYSTSVDTRGRRGDDRRRHDDYSSSRRQDRNGRRADRSYDNSPDDGRSSSRRDREGTEQRRGKDSARRRHSFDDDSYSNAPYATRAEEGRAPYPTRPSPLGNSAYGEAERPFGHYDRAQPPPRTSTMPAYPAQSASPAFDQQYAQAQARSAAIAPGYMPYANIYATPPQTNGPFAPPPPPASSTTTTTSPHPDITKQVIHPVMPPPGDYRQNPYAQMAPSAAAAGADAMYATPGSYPYPNSFQDSYNSRGRKVEGRYDGDGEFSTQSPYRPDRRSSKYEPTAAYPVALDPRFQAVQMLPNEGISSLRSRSERRSTEAADPKDSRASTKSRIKGSFDTSQRGLGYGAIGAVAGGLLGSEISSKNSSLLPVAIGATMGALGASAFQAHDRRREARLQDPSDPYGSHERGRAHRSGSSYYSD